MPAYDPEVIERFAVQLERRGRAVRRGCTIAGIGLGASFGSVPLTGLGRAWPIPHAFGFMTLLLGAGAGALIGWVVGDGRGEMYRLHAQTTLCQLHAQRTSLAIWRLLQNRPAEPLTVTAPPEFDFNLDLQPVDEPVPSPAPRLAAAGPVRAPEPEPVVAALRPQPVPERAFVREPIAAPQPALPDPLPLQPISSAFHPAPAAAPAPRSAQAHPVRPASTHLPPLSPVAPTDPVAPPLSR